MKNTAAIDYDALYENDLDERTGCVTAEEAEQRRRAIYSSANPAASSKANPGTNHSEFYYLVTEEDYRDIDPKLRGTWGISAHPTKQDAEKSAAGRRVTRIQVGDMVCARSGDVGYIRSVIRDGSALAVKVWSLPYKTMHTANLKPGGSEWNVTEWLPMNATQRNRYWKFNR